MEDQNTKSKSLFVIALLAFSVFLMWPKPTDWADSTNKFLPKIAELRTRLGIDLQGGTRLEYEVLERDHPKFQSPTAMTRLLRVLRTRIDILGVLEPNVDATGKYRFVIELPGVSTDLVHRIKGLMEKQGRLEFKLSAGTPGEPSTIADPALSAENERVQGQVQDAEELFPIEEFSDERAQGERIARHLNENVLGKRFADEWRYYFHYEDKELGGITARHVLVNKKVEISGSDIASSDRSMGQWGPVPAFRLKPEAKKRFCRITEQHRRGGGDERMLCIILDDHLVSAPGINDSICDGSAIIDGTFNEEEVADMVNVFTSGSLPVVPRLLREETTGPSIGVAAQRAGIIAAAIGLALIVLFMFAYYLGAGVVANLALLINAILIGGALTFFQATLTLPGIAGLILTIGMAVDANILIFERIREELGKGKTLSQAITNGYERAFVTILDANITTLITAAILFWIGTGSVKGFATTLIVGIATSMFTALFVTRLIFSFLEKIGLLTEMKMMNLIGKPSLKFMSMTHITAVISMTLVVAGMVLFGARFDSVQGIDLKGGTAFRIAVPKPMSDADLVDYLDQHVNAQVNGWIESGEWRTKLEDGGEDESAQPEAGAPAGEPDDPTRQPPGTSPLEGARVQGLFVTADSTRPEAESGLFWEFMVRSRSLSEDAYRLVEIAVTDPGQGGIQMQVKEKTEISSKVARETALDTLVAIFFAIGAILVYITMRFEFHFGLAAVLALVHDVAIALGAISLFNMLQVVDVEINLPIVAALLTIIGYSLNDTIVVFDRIRENLRGSHRLSDELINESVNQTLSRTLLTSLTTFVVVGVLFALNYGRGSVVEGFSFTLLIGIIVGTYSSVFVASPFLLFWQRRVLDRKKDV